ncbi:MAG: hypothetical protein LIO46_03050, partial [Clostridiales bacterium]|nr:hypothetical protein [Clostridiales bacterium]
APFSPYSLHVANSQIEIDGGFENRNAFCLMEAKNVVHSDFLIRQLYYPLRCWRSRIAKLIRPVFLVYSNQVFRLLEYAFEAPECYNSIRIVREKRYSFEEVRITRRDLEALCREAAANSYKPVNPDIPFVQADSFDKVVSLLDCLCQAPLSPEEIADRFSFRLRQSDYYYNACRYLGLAQKQREADGTIRVHITDKGKRIMRLPYRQRQFGLIREILRHQIFHEVFRTALETGYIPDSRLIARRLVELNAAGPGVAYRRCSSVSGWVNWILGLCNE